MARTTVVVDPAFPSLLRQLREQRRMSLRRLAAAAYISHTHVWQMEEGQKSPTTETAAALDSALRAGGRLAALVTSGTSVPRPARGGLHRVEQLRRTVTEAISTSTMSEASVEDWERLADEHGRATRTRAAGAMLEDLVVDFAELTAQLDRRHPASILRRLTRVTAQMAGLMFLTLIKLDERTQARAWVRTAHLAAEEAGDPGLRSWVRAQEAYVHYYAGDLAQAVAVAEDAQRLAGRLPSVGVALAAALEGRAAAAIGDRHVGHAALATAEHALARLPANDVIPSAFGYSEAQLRFHSGNAHTHLGEHQEAWTAQQRALELYPAGDYLDRALVHLDRMACLVDAGEAADAVTYGATNLAVLAPEQRVGLVNVRAGQILDAVPAGALRSGPVAEFREMFALTAGRAD